MTPQQYYESNGMAGISQTLRRSGRNQGASAPTTGDYSIGDLAEVFAVSRPTVYRTLNRAAAPS